MGATRRNLQAQPKILKKIIETPNQLIRTKILPKNYVSYLKSVKATRRNLQAQPKMLKKIVGTSNQPIRTKNFPKKK
jgi:hypothetical protein